MMGAGSAGFCRMLVEDILSFDAMQEIVLLLTDYYVEFWSSYHELCGEEDYDLAPS